MVLTLWLVPLHLMLKNRCIRSSFQHLRQLGDVRCDAPRLIARHQPRRRSPAGLLLKVHIGEGRAGVILDDEARVRFGPRSAGRAALNINGAAATAGERGGRLGRSSSARRAV